jgi:16S rRNA (guanine527-N7)-methyltransferase
VPPRHPELLAQLVRARTLGFLGPGPVEAHIDHAAAFLVALADTTGTVVDLGSGGGVPGLVLAVARPDLRLVLVEARARRCRFLEEAIEDLGVDAEVVEGRAEELGHSPRRGGADAVVARGFGVPAATAECGSPLLRVGGRLAVSEPPPPIDPGRWPAAELASLGLVVAERVEAPTGVQVLEQRSPCPGTYPRRNGLPAKRPLF